MKRERGSEITIKQYNELDKCTLLYRKQDKELKNQTEYFILKITERFSVTYRF